MGKMSVNDKKNLNWKLEKREKWSLKKLLNEFLSKD